MFAVGATISLFTGRSAVYDGLRMLCIGGGAGAATYCDRPAARRWARLEARAATPHMLALQSLFGFFALHALAWLVSERRGAVAWRPVIAGMVLTVALAVVFLKLPLFSDVFLWLNRAVGAIDARRRPALRSCLVIIGGGPLPFEEKPQVSSFILAFRALPLVLVISALSALFYYWRVLPWLVRGFSWVFVRAMRLGGAVGLSAAANVFVGMVEAPLVVRPYIAAMSRSRALRDHDLRHGDDRGHGHGALRHVPRADGARCPRAHPDRFDHCHARRRSRWRC